jgi:NTE family protein
MHKKYSLILGGGAARGLAHIGVIRRLEELDLVPSEIIGTSIGALIWAFLALWYTSTEMGEIARNIPYLKLIDIDLRTGSLKGIKLMKYLDKYIGDKHFSDCVVPLKIVATDIDSGEKYVFSEGKILDAVRASIGIPGVFAPYKHAWRSLVDGGLVSNLPIEETREGTHIIAVSVQMELSRIKKVKRSRIFPNGTLFIHVYEAIRKTLAIMMARNEAVSLTSRSHVTLIRPGREDVEYYDFRKVDDMIEAGHEASTVLKK